MESENINIAISIIGLISTAIACYVGLKLKTVKSELESKLLSEDEYNEDKKSTEDKFSGIDERLRLNETDISIIDDRVKAIFKQMDKQSEQITRQFDKIELSIEKSFSSMEEKFEKQIDGIRAIIEKKQDKK